MDLLRVHTLHDPRRDSQLWTQAIDPGTRGMDALADRLCPVNL